VNGYDSILIDSRERAISRLDDEARFDKRLDMRDAPTLSVDADGDAPGPTRVVGLTLLGHPDPDRVGERAALHGLRAGQTLSLSRLEPAFSPPSGGAPRALDDPHVSRRPVQLAPTAEGGVSLSGEGAVTANGRPLDAERTFSREELEKGVVLVLAGHVVLLLHALDPSPPRGLPSFGLVGESPALVAVREEIQRVSDLPMALLLRGETGTGKELVARAVHEAGPRRRKPYVAVNMAAIPATLAAAELFGAARGAYTGADRRRSGYFSRAQGGTLFLDEIGETPGEVQPLLLRALESGEIQPVGDEAAIPIDVRVIAATDADLEQEVARGRFRAPLLHRLNAYEIHIPPLRERREDLGRLLVHFLRQELQSVGESRLLAYAGPGSPLWLPADVFVRFAGYAWPGNLRQLRNVVRRIAIGSRGRRALEVGADLDQVLRAAESKENAPREEVMPPAPDPKAGKRRFRRPAEVGESELLAALSENRWKVQPAAAQLGVSRTSLYALMERSAAIRRPADLAPSEIQACLEACQANLEAMAERLRVSRPALQRRLRDLGLWPASTAGGGSPVG
jgi:two-component system nitrogen regulation response regulator GlnG